MLVADELRRDAEQSRDGGRGAEREALQLLLVLRELVLGVLEFVEGLR
jgi:hypothetical protein